MNPDGKLVSDIMAPSSDLQLYLTLPGGTYCLDSAGNPVYWIYIKATEEGPTPPEGGLVITPYYEMEPDGTTFDPPILCTIKYGLWDIPEGVDPNDFVVMLWDPVNELWLPLETQVDTENKTISVLLSHFSIYTVMLVPRPAEFELSGFSITPPEVEIGESVNVSVTVKNTGDLSGDYDVILTINEESIETRTVMIAGRESLAVSFTFSPDTAGTHNIGINDVSGEVIVSAPPEPEVEPTRTADQVPTQEPSQEPETSPTETAAEPEPSPETTTTAETNELEPGTKVGWWLYVVIVAAILVFGLGIWLARSEWRRS